MKIFRISPLTGKLNTLDLDVTEEQIKEFESNGSRMIQDIFPNLSAEDREFIKTGYTKEDWGKIFGQD